jgi:hypothetical protein
LNFFQNPQETFFAFLEMKVNLTILQHPKTVSRHGPEKIPLYAYPYKPNHMSVSVSYMFQFLTGIYLYKKFTIAKQVMLML